MNQLKPSNIWAVGRNYREHAKELGNEIPSRPLIFLKAGSCATVKSPEIQLPRNAGEIHHELELGLIFDDNFEIHQAVLALDLTDRTAQSLAKEKGWPWTSAKSFKGSCPLTAPFPIDLNKINDLSFCLRVNGQIRQKGSPKDMIFSVQELIRFVCEEFPVIAGDLLLTGTPQGVGPLRSGDRVEAEVIGGVSHAWIVNGVN